MAMQVLKESTYSAARCRLNGPPSSPSRKSTTQAIARPPFKSRILAAIDLDVVVEDAENCLPTSVIVQLQAQKPAILSTNGETSNPPGPLSTSQLHPFFMAEQAASHDIGATGPSTTPALLYPPTDDTRDAASNLSFQEPGSSTLVPAEAGNPEPDVVTKPKARLYSYKDYKPQAKIVYTRQEEDADEIAEKLSGPLGFDMEWPVIMRRGVSPVSRRTATIQISDRSVILIAQVSAMKRFPQKLKALIENAAIPKIGANIRNDGQKLLKDYGVTPKNLIELGALAREADPAFSSKRSIVSLSKMIEEYCDGKILDKGPARMSKWDAVPLSQEQLTYAANDAHSALMAYRRIVRIAAIYERTLAPARFTSNLPHEPAVDPAPKELEPAAVQILKSRAGGTAANLPSSHSAPSDATSAQLPPREPIKRQELNAYRLWHVRNLSLDEMCAMLRSPEYPLAHSTVISYVVGALQAEPTLPFSMSRLKTLAQQEARSWARHRKWILSQEAKAQLCS
ncbi:ribonuclease H-like domain-containing protein [Cytidiella melzeri]|nr:ribonuclease H-like domain-containing protein [Cytidiella melzeri]